MRKISLHSVGEFAAGVTLLLDIAGALLRYLRPLRTPAQETLYPCNDAEDEEAEQQGPMSKFRSMMPVPHAPIIWLIICIISMEVPPSSRPISGSPPASSGDPVFTPTRSR